MSLLSFCPSNSPSVYRGATRESVACDDGNFSFPKSSQEGVAFPFGRRTRFQTKCGEIHKAEQINYALRL